MSNYSERMGKLKLSRICNEEKEEPGKYPKPAKKVKWAILPETSTVIKWKSERNI